MASAPSPPTTFVDSSPPNTRVQHPTPARQHRRSLMVRYTVSVPVAMAQYDHTGRVIKYMIRVADHLRATTKTVFRRFSDITELHERVGSRLAETKKLLPSKLLTARGNSSADEIEHRRVGLGQYFAAMLNTLFLETTPAPQRQQEARSTASSGSSGSSESAQYMEIYRQDVAQFLDLQYDKGDVISGHRELSLATSTNYGYFCPPPAYSTPTTTGSFAASISAALNRRRSTSPEADDATREPSSPALLSNPSFASRDETSPKSSGASAASSVWENAEQHREETWWYVPQSKLPPPAKDGGTRQSLNSFTRFRPLGESSLYHDTMTSGAMTERPRRRVIGFCLPLMECRLEIDGTWVLVVRHDRDSRKAIVRRRHGEAMHLLRHFDNCDYLPNVVELRELLRVFKVSHPEREFEDSQVRLQAMCPHPGFARRMVRADDEDADANRSIASTTNNMLKPSPPEGFDELNRDAVSEVTDAPEGLKPRPSRRNDAAHAADDMETLTGSQRRMIASDEDAPNSQHFPFSAITIVPSMLSTASRDDEAEWVESPPRAWRQWQFDDAANEAALSPESKVKIRARTALWEGCGCTSDHFCSSNGVGDVFRTRCGHCLVVHPKPPRDGQTSLLP